MQVSTDEAEPHMWNIVSIDGANYLVDITNCDEGSIGSPSELFLVGMGKVGDKYTKSIGNATVHYVYDDYTKQYFSESILEISETNYEIVGVECGKKAKWKLDGGTLTISGCSTLKSINIPKSVTNIGDFVFAYCSSLSEVTINSKEMEFGPNPFYGINIKTLNIPCSMLTPEEITEIFGDSVTVNYKHDIKYSASGLVISYACADCSDDTTKGIAEVKAEKAVYDGRLMKQR